MQNLSPSPYSRWGRLIFAARLVSFSYCLKSSATVKAKLEGKIGDHFDNLYEEDEKRAGQKTNEAIGSASTITARSKPQISGFR